MINEFVEVLSEKSKDQYKIIEDRYHTLRRYLKEWFIEHTELTERDVRIILAALEPCQINREDNEIEDNEIEDNEMEVENDE